MMKALFDETHEDNVERRMAIADCMNLSLREGVEESRKRTVAGLQRPDREAR
jgi:hypothetical protein